MGISCYFSCFNFFFLLRCVCPCMGVYVCLCGCVCVCVSACVVAGHVGCVLLGMCLRGWVDTGFSLLLVSVFPLSPFFLSLVGVLSAYMRAKSYYIIYIWGGRFWVPILGGNGGW